MVRLRWAKAGFVYLLISQVILSLFTPAIVSGKTPGIAQPLTLYRKLEEGLRQVDDQQSATNILASPHSVWTDTLLSPSEILDTTVPSTTLELSILSSPWAVLDHNDPTGSGGPVPHVFVVQAAITNTGSIAASDLYVNLDYNEDPANDWVLLNGENPLRVVDELASDEVYYAYWFAQYYTPTIGLSHQYTVTAEADNAELVSTSENYYNPETGRTVTTIAYQSTGNSGITARVSGGIVGNMIPITVTYDLGTDPDELIFSPVGNTEFDPSGYRLLDVQVRFYDDAEIQEELVSDRLFFSTVPILDGAPADFADVTYTFIVSTLTDTIICPYTAVDYGITQKYDQFYCDPIDGTIPITSTLTFSLDKQAPSAVQQGETLTYTVNYTNTGDLPLSYVWIWDDIDISIGSIITPTIDPPTGEITDTRVAWKLGDVGATGQITSTGTLSFSIDIDGAGQDLSDGTQLANHAFFGINQGTLPQDFALTAIYTSTVQAPNITIAKTDGLERAEISDPLTYTLSISNTGSITATGLVIIDALPAGVTLAGTPSIPPDDPGIQPMVWSNLPDLAPYGDVITITIPVTVNVDLADMTVITNTMTARYENQAGHIYETQTATDTTVFREASFVHGYTFADADGNGIYDPGENGISGVTVTLSSALDPITTTDSNGYYHFRIEVEEPISVTAALPSDYFRTTPGNVITDSVFGITQSVNFGYAPITSTFGIIHGTVFEDANGDGQRSNEEIGIPGVLITLDSIHTTSTDQYGNYTLATDIPGTHVVVETDPVGYTSTTPNLMSIEVELSNSHQADFGDMITCTCAGDAYEDDDTPAQASEIQIGQAFIQNRNFCDDATDWITFFAESGDLYTITTSSWGLRADTFLALYNTDGHTLLSANDDYEGTTDYSSQIVWKIPQDGVYYLHVTNRAGLTGCLTNYDIWIERINNEFLFLPLIMKIVGGTDENLSRVDSLKPSVLPQPAEYLSPSGVINHTCADVYEIDDNWEQAYALEPGVLQKHSFDSNPAQYAADKDFLLFDLKAQQTITFTVTSVRNTQTLLELYDQTGIPINVTGTTELVYSSPIADRYYMSVSPMATTTYGCADVVGYDLLAEMSFHREIFIPLISR